MICPTCHNRKLIIRRNGDGYCSACGSTFDESVLLYAEATRYISENKAKPIKQFSQKDKRHGQ